MLRRLDDLESRIASRVSAHRRRAANILEETSTFRKTHMRIFISHRVEGGGDDEDDNDEEDDDNNTKGETTVEEGNNNDDDDAKTGVVAAAAAPRPGGGGKDFSALLHSSAHKAVDSESTTTSSQHPSPSRKKGVRKWTLVIEGGLLIPQTDHESAKNTNVRLENGLPILGWREEVVNGESNPSAAASAGGGGGGGSGGENNNTKTTPTTNTTTKADIPMRDQWRGGTTERENEKDVEPPLKFTHLFDKIEVTFNVIKQLSDSSNNNNNNIKGLEPTDNVAITRSGFGSSTTPLDPSSSTALDSSAENNAPTVTWERHAKKTSSSTSSTTTPDAHAFFVVHNEEGEYKPMGGKVFKRVFPNTSVAAKIKLYRRQPEGGEENYAPSTQLCNIFFPTFIGKRGVAELKSSKDKSSSSSGGGGGSSKSKKRKRPGEGGLSRTVSSANLENEASINTTALSQDEEATTATGGAATSSANLGQGGASSTIDETKDAHIPNTVTMDEALYAIFYYIKTRNLQDVTDLSIVNNNDVLTDLFGCSRMLFSSVRGLLLERQLLVKVESDTHPLIFNYEMTLEGAEPLLAKQRRSAKASNKSEDVELTTRRRVANPDYEDPPTPPVADQLDVVHHQTMLSCDVDIDIPSLFPVQTRDILRRTKYREFEYSSNRNKAIRALVSTKVDEETAKLVVADAVSGKGFASYHKQALMAMAKGSHEGGEAQRAAWIDLRTAALMEKLEEQSSLARGCWDVVDACQGLADQSS